jgi:hypothetical protein
MPSIFLTIASMFAGPIGAMLNKGLAIGAASFVAWSTAKGLPLDSASNIAGLAVAAISTAISGVAASQGVQIPIINADTSNGVKVVRADASAQAVDGTRGPGYRGGPHG